jgi:hypothetical protein
MYYSILSPQELHFIMETAKAEVGPGEKYVELGAFAMGTIGRVAPVIPQADCIAVDTNEFTWLDTATTHDTRDYLKEKFPSGNWTCQGVHDMVQAVCDKHPNITLYKDYSRSKVFWGAKFQFIDADHSYEQVIADFWHCWAQAAPNSMILGHDYNIPDTERAVKDIAKVLGREPVFPIEFPTGSLWYFRKT